jgi:SAM-dependent methyltransferase
MLNREFEEYKRRFINYHDGRLAEFGTDVCAVWNGVQAQEQRFRVLTEIGDLNRCAILDVGCGLGDLYGYLQGQGYTVDYLGMDINPQMVEFARIKYPAAEFRVMDLIAGSANLSFDYVLASGIFFFPFLNRSRWDKYVITMLEKMFSLSKEGCATNFLSTISEKPDGFSIYSDPWHILKLIQKTISKWVTIRHDYRLNDFTLYIYHESRYSST